MIGIYCITNLINGKKYIGQSNNVEKRWGKHRKSPFNSKNESYNSPFYQAIRKYGLDNFSFEIIEECKIEELDEKEIYWISFYQTFPPDLGKGYNLTPGGDKNIGNNKILPYLDEIKYLLQHSNLTQLEIAKKYGVAQGVIYDFNTGDSWYDENINYPIRKYRASYKKDKNIVIKENKQKQQPKEKKDRRISIPPYEELLKSLYDLKNKELVAQKYGVSGNLVRKWCHNYGINAQDKKSYIEKYEKEFLNKDPKKKRPYKQIIAQIDPKSGETIKTFNSRKEVREYLGLNPGCDKPLINAMKNKNVYKGYFWKLLN